MLVRVEFVAGLRVDFFDVRGVKRFLQFVQRHLHAHFQRVEIAALVEQRHFEIVFDGQHFGGEFLSGKLVRIGDFLLMAAAQVLLVRQAAQFAVFQLSFQLSDTRLQFFVRRWFGSFGLFGIGGLGGFCVYRLFGFVLILFVMFAHFMHPLEWFESNATLYKVV